MVIVTTVKYIAIMAYVEYEQSRRVSGGYAIDMNLGWNTVYTRLNFLIRACAVCSRPSVLEFI